MGPLVSSAAILPRRRWLVVAAAGLAAALAIVAAGTVQTDRPSEPAAAGPAKHAETELILDEIRAAGIEYIAYHHACFHATDDIRVGLYATMRVRDAWNSPIAIDCAGRTVDATSPGPDRVAGTDDDLHVADTVTDD